MPALEGMGVKLGMAVKTVPGSPEAGKQRLAEKLLSQQLQTELPSWPTRLGSKTGLNPRNPLLLPRASCQSNTGQGPHWEQLSQEGWGSSSVLTEFPPEDSTCEVPVLCPGKAAGPGHLPMENISSRSHWDIHTQGHRG